jgi:hypothetical protein
MANKQIIDYDAKTGLARDDYFLEQDNAGGLYTKTTPGQVLELLQTSDLPDTVLVTPSTIGSSLQAVEDAAGNASALYASSNKVCVGTPLTSGISAFSFGVFSGSGAYATTRCTVDDSECFFGTDGDPGRGIVGTLTAHELLIRTNNLSRIKIGASGEIGFFGVTPTAKPTVSGSRGGNAALASLLTALANLGLITDSTT